MTTTRPLNAIAPATVALVPVQSLLQKAAQLFKGRRLSSEVIDPKALSEEAREALARKLYSAHSRIFDGVSYESFVEYVIKPAALRTRIEVFRNSAGREVGYTAVHFYRREVGEQSVVVMRCECGMERGHRGGSAGGNLMAWELVRWLLTHPGRPLWWLGSLIHPSSYRALAQRTPDVYPRWDRPTPIDVQQHLDALADSFGLEPVSPQNPEICHVGWQTRDTARDQRYWASRQDPETRFFMARNPTYAQGHGMVTGAKLTLGGVLGGTLELLLSRASALK